MYRLRKTAAADKLRATYDGLSRDPNSLANLDQDLPNYMQSMVPIYSLPGNWLWCETWCTMESRDDAKTIDLVRSSSPPSLDTCSTWTISFPPARIGRPFGARVLTFFFCSVTTL